ncbi:MAG TPA: hypothetical protein DC046_08140 [Rhodospirillaceae bacterium]|nr:hypothetical protein [Rhodospirillaceae bacterium]
MNQNIIEYYRQLRVSEDLMAAFSLSKTPEDVADTAVEQGDKLGFSFTKEEALAAGMNFKALCNEAANDDELTEFELEMISAGTSVQCVDTSA